MELILVRHGQPVRIDNAAGAADPDLTDLGHRQASAAAQWLAEDVALDALYVSPMARALQTAVPFEQVYSLPALVVDGVKEYDAEESSYVPMEDLRHDKVAWRRFVESQVKRSYATFTETVNTALEAIIADHAGQTVAVVCHGGVINMWAATVLGIDPPTMFFTPEYTSIHRFKAASSGQRGMVSLNETAHLRLLESVA